MAFYFTVTDTFRCLDILEESKHSSWQPSVGLWSEKRKLLNGLATFNQKSWRTMVLWFFFNLRWYICDPSLYSIFWCNKIQQTVNVILILSYTHGKIRKCYKHGTCLLNHVIFIWTIGNYLLLFATRGCSDHATQLQGLYCRGQDINEFCLDM